jgi:hypothetical protein
MRMSHFTDRVVAVIAVCCALAIVLAFLRQWLLFGLSIWLLITMGLALGFGRATRHRSILATLAFILLAYVALLLGMAWLHDPTGAPDLVLGLPIGAALLVYGIWPLSLVPTVLVTVMFDRWVLRVDQVEALVAEFGQSQEDT